MAYNTMAYGPSQCPPPFFDHNMANTYSSGQDDLLGIQQAWVDNIDPLLQNSVSSRQQPWQNQQQPLQRFIGEPERNFFTTTSNPKLQPRARNIPAVPISTFPQTRQTRIESPTLSYDIASTCSSARSPGIENDWYLDCNNYYPQSDDYYFSNFPPQTSQIVPDFWTCSPQQEEFPHLAGFNGVNMSQIQSFADPQEVTFEADEGYIEMEMKSEYTIEVDAQQPKFQGGQSPYMYPSDEGIGSSIKDEASPRHPSPAQIDIDDISDADAEGDDVEDIIVAEAISDPEYSPTSPQVRKRRASKAMSPPASKRGRIIKSLPKYKEHLVCKFCNHEIFKDITSLQRHVASVHTRAFVCVFDFAGCQSTFASKNEWKRHVSSQHLNLHSWVCDLGSCAKAPTRATADDGNLLRGSEFNRKDLFTQHLRRMHAPNAVKRLKKKDMEWEEKLKMLQANCLRVKRHPPTRLSCPLNGCDTLFEGATCWDERMEHVGKHLEKAGTSSGKDGVVVKQVDDPLLVAWATREEIVEKRAGGQYRLIGTGGSRSAEEDVDDE